MQYQVVERYSKSSDWQLVRYNARIMPWYKTKEEAVAAANMYLTHLNCDNALARDEKLSAIEAFMLTDDGVFLGILNGKEWFLTYPKDVSQRDPQDRTRYITQYRKGEAVKDVNYFALDGKSEVCIREVPGTNKM